MSSSRGSVDSGWKWTAILSTAALVGVIMLRDSRKKFVYRRRLSWWHLLFKSRRKSQKCEALELADAMVQAVERHLLPLTCTGIVSGEGLSGMVVLKPNGEVLSAATTGEKWCSLHSCEMLAIEEAIFSLKQQAKEKSRIGISDCIFVSTHRSSVIDFGLPLLKKCGVTKIYSLFESCDYSSSNDGKGNKIDQMAEEEIASIKPNGKPPVGVLGRGEFKLVCGIEIVPVLDLIGEINTKAREFESEEHLKRQMAIDKRKLKLQTRLFTINRVYKRLASER